MLDYTPKEMVERETLVINPAKICQPIGAILAYKGIHNCMPITHGSQGCSSYLRMVLPTEEKLRQLNSLLEGFT